MTKRILALFAVALLLGADKPGDAARDDLKRMQGEWKVEKAQRGGRDAPPAVLEKLTMKIDGNIFSVSEGGARDEKAEVTLDPGKKPATMDIKPSAAGRDTVLGIYKFDGETLTMCWSKGGQRPTEFASKEGTEQVLFVMKKKK